ncbi:hypothetical protein [Streptomyces cavernae]|uniref:hypothetical protein n=1 Tax=Streptomyces cavernae TaxID=2259034 RepID=UPI000FEC1DEC|nr:hypothetical protein [Streptomyces cavernae]
MSSDTPFDKGTAAADSPRGGLTIAGGLMLGGFLVNIISTAFHPSGDEDDHRAVFTEYADSSPWVAVHLGQFVGVVLALSGLLLLYRVLRRTDGLAPLPSLAAAATVATAAAWAVLQGLDGVGLQQAAEAWQSASGMEKRIRYANAETVRWLEWGLQSYFRVFLGLAFLLFGAALLASRRVAGWLGWAAVLAGLCSVTIGVDVGYNGLASGLQDVMGLTFLALALVFAIGILLTGTRERARQRA